MKSKILYAIIILFSINSYSQYITKKEFEKAKKELPLETDQIKKARLLNTLALYYVRRNESLQDIKTSEDLKSQSFEIGKEFGAKDIIATSMHIDILIAVQRKNIELATMLKNKALEYTQRNLLKNQEAEIYRYMGLDFEIQSTDSITREKYIRKANTLFKEAHNLYGEGETYADLADFYEKTPDTAFKYAKKAIAIKKHLKNPEFYRDYTMVIRVYFGRGMFKEGLAHALQADLNAEKSQASPRWRCIIYNQLGIIYESLNKHHEALIAYKRGLNMAIESKRPNFVETLRFNLARYLYDNNKIYESLAVMKDIKSYEAKDCNTRYQSMYMLLYTKLKQYNKAKTYYTQLLQCDRKKPREIAVANRSIMRYLLMTGQADKSYFYINELKKQAILEKDYRQLLVAEKAFYSADSAVGNCAAALEHFKNYKILNDSIFNSKNSQQYNDLQLKYDTEKKDKNIVLLKQQSVIHQQTIRKAEILRYLFIASFLVLVLLIALLYNRSRIKQRAQNKINEQNDQLKILLSEKEWLMKEIHHRVKNNLQIVISLLSTQSEYLENEYALAAIQNSQNRMYAMSLIHQKLYQSDDLATIDMAWYIQELVSYLKDCFHADKKINYELDTECIELDVTQAVPLGLILNEAVSNAIKYAFTSKDSGKISIELRKQDSEKYRLVIKDNGVGLPKGFELQGQDSLGMNLMVGLANQINGIFEIENMAGLTIIITFNKRNTLI